MSLHGQMRTERQKMLAGTCTIRRMPNWSPRASTHAIYAVH